MKQGASLSQNTSRKTGLTQVLPAASVISRPSGLAASGLSSEGRRAACYRGGGLRVRDALYCNLARFDVAVVSVEHSTQQRVQMMKHWPIRKKEHALIIEA